VSKSVLDASALLAYLFEEPGAEFVEHAISLGSSISTVNWAEVLSKTADIGVVPEHLASELHQRGILDRALRVFPLIEEDSLEIARLRPLTQSLGLSLGDRACLALGKRLGAPVITADRAWKDIPWVEIKLIR